MKISDKGLQIIKNSESLDLNRYICPTGHPTIGWGHKIRKTDYFKDNKITLEKAEQLLRADTAIAQRIVNSAVKVKITQSQFDALVSFVFNIGGGKFTEDHCALLRLLNAGVDKEEVAKQFIRWNKGKKKVKEGDRIVTKKLPLPGLTTRRKEEAELFLSE